MVVDLTEAIGGEAQQIQVRRPGLHALELVDRVELHQRGIIAAAVHGDVGLDEECFGELMQRREHLAALDFAAHFLVAEILGLLAQCAHAREVLVGFEEAVQTLAVVSAQILLQQ